jgi:hypothetical protein
VKNNHAAPFRNIPHPPFSSLLLHVASVLLISLLALTVPAQAQIFVDDYGNLSEYSTAGQLITSDFLPQFQGAPGYGGDVSNIATSGNDIYVDVRGVIGEYTDSGQTVNASLFNLPPDVSADQLTVSGSTVYFVSRGSQAGNESGVVGEFTPTGGVSILISGLDSPDAVVVSGSNLYVGFESGPEINAYSTAGTLESNPLIAGIGSYGTNALGVSGNKLYVVNGGGAVGKYSTSDGTGTYDFARGYVGSLAISGEDLYTYDEDYGQIAVFDTTTGATVNSNLIPAISSGQQIILAIGPNGTPALEAASSSSTVASGGTYSATTVAPLTAVGGLGTTLSLIGGTSSGATVTLATTNIGANFTSLASDVVSVSGNAGDKFTVQLTFNLAAANLVGGAANMTLLWLNPATGKWENAVYGNSDGGLSAEAFTGAYDPTDNPAEANLGAYGVDTTDDTVWAVIDHNSDFGAGNLDEIPVATPEPSALLLILLGLALPLCRSRLRAHRL